MDILIVCLLLFAHFLGDFIAQTDEMANNKYKIVKWMLISPWLLLHSLVYSIIVTLIAYAIYQLGWFGAQYEISFLYLFLIMFISHIIIDLISSNVTHKLWLNHEYRSFFDVIGLDQLTHHFVLLFTVYYLFY